MRSLCTATKSSSRLPQLEKARVQQQRPNAAKKQKKKQKKHKKILRSNNVSRDFPGGAVVKNPPANAGDTGSGPGPGRSHMPRSS